MRQSLRLIMECINVLPEGTIKTDDRKITPPSKTYERINGIFDSSF